MTRLHRKEVSNKEIVVKKLTFALATTIAMVSFAMPASARVTHHRVISQASVATVYYDPWGYSAYSGYAYYP